MRVRTYITHRLAQRYRAILGLGLAIEKAYSIDAAFFGEVRAAGIQQQRGTMNI